MHKYRIQITGNNSCPSKYKVFIVIKLMFTVWVEHKYKRRTKKIFRKANIIQDEK